MLLFLYFHFLIFVGLLLPSPFISLFPVNEFFCSLFVICLPSFFFLFSNLSLVSLLPFLSFFLASKGVGNFCPPLKSLSYFLHSTRCTPCLRNHTSLAFYILLHFIWGGALCPLLSLHKVLSLCPLFLNMAIVFNVFFPKSPYF